MSETKTTKKHLPDALKIVRLLEKCAIAEDRPLLFDAARLIRSAFSRKECPMKEESKTTFVTDERLEWLSEFFKNLSIFCAGALLGTYL